MTNEFKLLPRWIITLFLWVGLLAGIAIRLLGILNRIDPQLSNWVWRFAMLCYTFFFGYRYMITRRRRRMITNHDLAATIRQSTSIDPVKQEALLYILGSISRSKELFNYAFICILSLAALTIDFFIR